VLQKRVQDLEDELAQLFDTHAAKDIELTEKDGALDDLDRENAALAVSYSPNWSSVRSYSEV
jgi:hypothetical protein